MYVTSHAAAAVAATTPRASQRDVLLVIAPEYSTPPAVEGRGILGGRGHPRTRLLFQLGADALAIVGQLAARELLRVGVESLERTGLIPARKCDLRATDESHFLRIDLARRGGAGRRGNGSRPRGGDR